MKVEERTLLAMQASVEAQKAGGNLVSSTVDRLNSGMVGIKPVIKSDYLMQKQLLHDAYSERGVGLKLDTEA